MADVKSVSLVLNDPTNGVVGANVVVVTRFSQREMDEGFDYGVNVMVVRDLPDSTLITRHAGMTAMTVTIVPPSLISGLAAMSASKVIKPTDPDVTTRFLIENTDQAWPTGSKLLAVVTVVPEIAETMKFSATAVVA